MKKLFLILTTVALTLSLHSCEELDISFEDVILEETLAVNNLIPEGTQGSYSFSKSSSFSLAQADNGSNSMQSLGDYIDGLSSVSIQSLEFTIVDVPQEQSLNVDSLVISISNAQAIIYTEIFTNIQPDVTESALELSKSAMTAISSALVANETLTLSIKGLVTGDAKSFDLEARMTLDIKANVIDTAQTLIKDV